MGGKNAKSKIVAVICWPMHDRIDNSDWGNGVREFPGRGRVYFAWDLHGNTLIEKDLDPVLSAAAEAVKSGSIIRSDRGDEGKADPTLPRGSEGILKPDSVAAHTSAAAPSAGKSKEESDARQTVEQGGQGQPVGTNVIRGSDDLDNSGGSSPGISPDSGGDSDNRPAALTHEQRVAIAQEIHDTEWNRQWYAGDTGNAWIAEMGESAEQYLSDFGYVHESLANILRVCAAIPPAYRNGNLRFSHHVVVYDQPPEDRMRWLTECEEEQWSVAEFRRQVKGTKPRVKRYSLEELYELGRRFGEEYSYVGPYQKFLDWLEEQA
jgi:hypothetical protein